MRIGELARRTGLAPSAIRYYERRDMFSPGQISRHPNGYRDYTDDAERRVQLILAGRQAGFGLEEMRSQMAEWDSMSDRRRAELLDDQLRVIDARIEELTRTRVALSAAREQLTHTQSRRAMRIPIVQIDAFAESPFEGNPAAVLPLEHWLSDAVLQQIARENNLSETAFLVAHDADRDPAPDGNLPAYDLRWFTPVTEVDLCGHATLAASSYLFADIHPDVDTLQFSTNSGWLVVERFPGDLLTMDLPAETPIPVEVDRRIEQALGAAVVEAHRATDLIYTVADAATVRGLTPDFATLASLPVRGVVVTAPGDVPGVDFVSRWFGAQAGVSEDPLTGSAHSQLAPLWARRLDKTAMTARQLSARGGTITIGLDGERAKLSGRCVRYLDGVVQLSP